MLFLFEPYLFICGCRVVESVINTAVPRLVPECQKLHRCAVGGIVLTGAALLKAAPLLARSARGEEMHISARIKRKNGIITLIERVLTVAADKADAPFNPAIGGVSANNNADLGKPIVLRKHQHGIPARLGSGNLPPARFRADGNRFVTRKRACREGDKRALYGEKVLFCFFVS